MKIVIIEDEKLTADDLSNAITKIDPEHEIVAVLSSVQEANSYFANNLPPDLIFSDIQLGDGLSFEIFAALTIPVPVVFCTAFDEYALRAFQANGIDYLLKPFTLASVYASIAKFKNLRGLPLVRPSTDFHSLIDQINAEQRPSAILVYFKDIIQPVKVEDIALFYVENEITQLVTFDRKVYYPKGKLDELEKTMGRQFFRANRQFLLNRKSIVNASSYLSRKLSITLSIPFQHVITVSKEKTPQFLSWLAGNDPKL